MAANSLTPWSRDCLQLLGRSAVAVTHQFRTIVQEWRLDVRLSWRGRTLVPRLLAPGISRFFRRLFTRHIVMLQFAA
jgi:hypothetical protein